MKWWRENVEGCPLQHINEIDFCIIYHDLVILLEAESNFCLCIWNRLLYEGNWQWERPWATGSLKTLFAEGNWQWERPWAIGGLNIPLLKTINSGKRPWTPFAEDNCAGKKGSQWKRNRGYTNLCENCTRRSKNGYTREEVSLNPFSLLDTLCYTSKNFTSSEYYCGKGG